MVTKISEDTKREILKKSAYALPDRPSEQGYSVSSIKEKFYKPIIDEKQSIVSEINRIVDEINAGGNVSIKIDDEPTEGSENAVSSGGVYNQLSLKQNALIAGKGISINGRVISARLDSVSGVNTRVATHCLFKSQNITPQSSSIAFYEESLDNLPFDSADQIVAMSVQYKIYGISFNSVLVYRRDTTDEYNHYFGSGELMAFSDISTYQSYGETVPPDAASISVMAEVPPLFVKVYKDVAGKISLRVQFVRNNVAAGVAFDSNGRRCSSGMSLPTITSGQATKLTIQRIDLAYLTSEVVKQPIEEENMITYYCETRSYSFMLTAPAGLMYVTDLIDYAMSSGYTCSDNALPVSECYDWNLETSVSGAGLWASKDGLLYLASASGNVLETIDYIEFDS